MLQRRKGEMLDWGGGIWGSKSIFNLCSHIEFNTENPNLILQITICFTRTPNMPKYFLNFAKNRKIVKNKQLYFFSLYKLHNSYFVMFWKFVIFVILGFLYLYIFIYYRCRSLTRVGLLHV